MTRENKLALVLGFGLMLFVGILVSDHLAARNAPPLAVNAVTASSEVLPPFPSPGGSRNQYLYVGRTEPTRTLSPEPAESARPNEPRPLDRSDRARSDPTPAQSGWRPEAIPEAPGTNEESAAPIAPPEPASQLARTYTVKEGDTFAAIAAREYGRRVLGEQLADFNKINPRSLRVGAKITLPSIEELDPSRRLAAAQRESRSVTHRSYTVREGDNLYRIADRELGRGSRWEELATFNRDVLKNTNDLFPGMQLRIPVDGRNITG